MIRIRCDCVRHCRFVGLSVCTLSLSTNKMNTAQEDYPLVGTLY